MARIIYSIQNSNGDVLSLNGDSCNCIEKGTTTLGSDRFDFDNKVEPKSGEDGSVKLGKARIKSRSIEVSFTIAYPTNQELRDVINEMMVYIRDMDFLVNNTDSLRIPASMVDYDVDYESGSYQLLANCSFTFEALSPYWEDLTETEQIETVNGGDINDIMIDTGSFLEVPPLISFTSALSCPSLQVYVLETKQGIEVTDTIFGTPGFEVMEINNEEGTLTLGTLDRSQNIATSTGFFKIPPGTSTLRVIPTEDLEVAISYRKRYFI